MEGKKNHPSPPPPKQNLPGSLAELEPAWPRLGGSVGTLLLFILIFASLEMKPREEKKKA